MRRLVTTALAIFALDQLAKLWVLVGLDLATRGRVDLWPPFLTFRMAWNRGVNFGLAATDGDVGRWLLIAVAVIISGGVVYWVAKSPMRPVGQIAAGLLVGGALANALDRLIHGAVADFLNMSCCGVQNPWSFNIADVGVFAGAVGLAFFSGEKRGQETP